MSDSFTFVLNPKATLTGPENSSGEFSYLKPSFSPPMAGPLQSLSLALKSSGVVQ